MTDWFRSWHGAPTDPKWLGIARKAGVIPGVAVAIAWALMDRASQAEERGSINGYDADGLACFYGCEPEQVEAIVKAMGDKGIIVDGRFANWERRQPKREDSSTERVREYRKRIKDQVERCETQRNAPDTDTDTDIDISPLTPPLGVADGRSNLEDPISQTETEADLAEEPKRPKASKRGTRIDPDWKPSDEDRAFAVSVGIPEREIERHGAEFRDYWAGVGGAKGVKLDWPATWRNRCRQIADHKGYRPPAGALAVHGSSPASPPGWPTDLPDPERLFAIWSAGRWSQTAWGFPPGDPSCRIPTNVVSEWQKRRQEAA